MNTSTHHINNLIKTALFILPLFFLVMCRPVSTPESTDEISGELTLSGGLVLSGNLVLSGGLSLEGHISPHGNLRLSGDLQLKDGM